MQIILDKITTPDELPRLSRTRLLDLLNDSIRNCTSTIVNGRAGTGKTLLAADFARRCGRQVSWYKVDAADGDPQVFFRYFVESIRQSRPGFGQEALMKLVLTGTLKDIPMLADAFVHELLEHKAESLLSVIDDLHLIYDAEWVVPFFRRLLPLLPVEAHILITGRSLPPAPLWRMRSKQTLCVVEEPTLALTELETQQLFASYRLTEAQADVALKQTRGRASIIDAMGRELSEERDCQRTVGRGRTETSEISCA